MPEGTPDSLNDLVKLAESLSESVLKDAPAAPSDQSLDDILAEVNTTVSHAPRKIPGTEGRIPAPVENKLVGLAYGESKWGPDSREYETTLLVAMEEIARVPPTNKIIYGNLCRILERIEETFPSPHKDLFRYEDEYRPDGSLQKIKIYKYLAFAGDFSRAKIFAKKYKKIILSRGVATDGVLKPPYYLNYDNILTYDKKRKLRSDEKLKANTIAGLFPVDELRTLLYITNNMMFESLNGALPTDRKLRFPLSVSSGHRPDGPAYATAAGIALQTALRQGAKPSKKLKDWLRKNKRYIANHILKQPGILAQSLGDLKSCLR